MKNLIMILFAAVALSCGDGNRSSERNKDLDDNNTEMAEPDTADVDTDNGRDDSRMDGTNRYRSDTTSTRHRDRDDRHSADSLNNK